MSYYECYCDHNKCCNSQYDCNSYYNSYYTNQYNYYSTSSCCSYYSDCNICCDNSIPMCPIGANPINPIDLIGPPGPTGPTGPTGESIIPKSKFCFANISPMSVNSTLHSLQYTSINSSANDFYMSADTITINTPGQYNVRITLPIYHDANGPDTQVVLSATINSPNVVFPEDYYQQLPNFNEPLPNLTGIVPFIQYYDSVLTVTSTPAVLRFNIDSSESTISGVGTIEITPIYK